MKRGIVGLTYVGALVLVGFFLIPSVLAGQGASETFTAIATGKTDKVSGAEPVKIVIDRYLTDAERTSVLDALKAGGTTAAREALAKMPDIGSLEVLGKTTPIKYAFVPLDGPRRRPDRHRRHRPADPLRDGRHVRRQAQGRFRSRPGDARFSIRTTRATARSIRPPRSRPTPAGSIVIDDYGAVKVWLKNVAKAK